MQNLITLTLNDNPVQLVLYATGFFFVIYCIFASLVYLLTKQINRPIETRVVSGKQMATELANSMRTIALFGVGMIVPWWLIQNGLARIDGTPSHVQVVLECATLIVWNDIHFYLVHRLLHTQYPWFNFKTLHITHHKSVSATPFAAYSMSIAEASLLGSVMPMAMLLWDFSAISLLFLPIWSISINALAHSNCDIFPHANQRSCLGLVKHHQDHHSYYRGNYSFFFWQLDALFGTLGHIIKKDTHDTL
jgi:sterol desaturase/sphingolipid hydroxylase (fatty acid hydroxylase superfamily)